jgi:glycyl-tRNA synthetase beta subunit
MMGLLCIPLASALQDFSIQQKINRQFDRFKAGLLNNTELTREHGFFLRRIQLLYSNVHVDANQAVIDLVINVPSQLADELQLQKIHSDLAEQTKTRYGVDKVTLNISMIPTKIYRFNLETGSPK